MVGLEGLVMSLAQKQIEALKGAGFSIQEIQNGIMKTSMMELRDQLAMSARHEDLAIDPEADYSCRDLAKIRYKYADIMLEVRNG